MNDKERIFREELSEMKRHNFISPDEYEGLSNTYGRFTSARAKYYEEQARMKKVQKAKEDVKPQKVLTPQEVRERNITWVLILGVIMVLLSGLLLATSNWNIMNNTVKTFVITLVSVLFFGTSIISDKWLKISKTALAFWVLGSLFLPVAILSAGYFGVFGNFLSIFGEGRYIYGALGTTLCLPVYAYSTKRYEHRLFAWFTLIGLSIDVGFVLAALHLSMDVFYLGTVIYNGLLLVFYHSLKDNKYLKLFVNELSLFTQVNLIISTAFLIFFYKNPLYYGFNVILTSLLYIMMVYAKQGKREYSFVFSSLLVYGIYEIVENSSAASKDVLLFSLAGFIFLGIEYIFRREESLKKIFAYTSGVVSFCAFIFVSYQALTLRTGHSSFLLFLSYSLIAVNYAYLAYSTGMKVFSWLAPFFIVAAGNQCFGKPFKWYDYSVHMFIVGLLIFLIFYFKNHWKYTERIRLSSGAVSVAVMLFSLFNSLYNNRWGIAAFLFYCFTFVLYLIFKSREIPVIRSVAKWAIPVTLFTGSTALYGAVIAREYYKTYLVTFHVIICVAVIFGLSLLWKKIDRELEAPFFWVPHILMPLCALSLLLEGALTNRMDAVAGGYAIVLGIYIASAFKYKKGWKYLLFTYMSFVSLVSFLGLLASAVHLEDIWYNYITMCAGLIIAAFWFISGAIRRKYTAYFLVPYSVISLFYFNTQFNHGKYGIREFILSLAWAALVLFINYYHKWRIVDIFPLLTIFTAYSALNEYVLKADNKMTVLLLIIFIVLKITGELLSKKLFEFKGDIFIDWYTAAGFFALILASGFIHKDASLWLKLLVPVLVSYTLFSQIKRVENAKGVVKTISYISLMLPYYTLIDDLAPPFIFRTELNVLPWIGLTIAISKRVWQNKENIMGKVEFGVLLITASVLFRDIFAYYYIEDGLILGVLCLVSIIAGMQLHIKSYFFIGSGALLLNIIIQTREFWKSIPWWVYLLIAGLILIVTASLNEMQKNSRVKKLDKQAILEKFNKWK